MIIANKTIVKETDPNPQNKKYNEIIINVTENINLYPLFLQIISKTSSIRSTIDVSPVGQAADVFRVITNLSDFPFSINLC